MSIFSPKNKSDQQRATLARDWRHLSKLFEQLPPHTIEAEMSLLGSVLLDPRVIGDVILIVRNGESFFKPANGAVYDAMIELYDTKGSVDIVQLHQVLVDRDILDTIGGQEYLIELANAVPSAANARHYANLVREKAMIRKLIETAGDILYDAYHSPEDARSILEEAEQRIFHIAQESEHASSQSLKDLIDQTMKFLDENEGRAITGVASGFAELDEMTSGLQKGELIIVAARPSMGKTALALNIAEQVALQGKAVAVFSLEMSRQQLVQRLLCSRSGVDSHRLRRNMLRDNEWNKLHKACDQLMDAPILIDDTPGLSSMQLRAKARRMASKHKLEMVVIDYLQLMTSGHRAESRQQEVSEISRAVKAMARELEVPVVCLSQLNRAAEQREGHRPRMADLRESGSIEQDADVIMMLHREEYYHLQDPHWIEDNPDKVNVAELIVAKQRNGPTGTVKLTWIPMSTRFRDHTMAGDMGHSYEPKPAAGSASGGGASGGAPFSERPYQPAASAPTRRASSSAAPSAVASKREPDPATDDIYDPDEDSGIPF